MRSGSGGVSATGCPRCSMGSSSGFGQSSVAGDEDAQTRIMELEEQIRVLNEKAVETGKRANYTLLFIYLCREKVYENEN